MLRAFRRGTPWSFVLALLAPALSGCASSTPIHAPASAESPLPEPQLVPYLMRVGDRLAIKFWGNSELDQEVRIRPDGYISLPLVDEVLAAGRRPAELDEELTRLYATELARPEITVILVETLPPRIHVGGEVVRVGPLDMEDSLTLSRAIQEAGGFLPSARRREVLLIRVTVDGTAIARSIDLRPVLSGADPSADVALQPRDLIFVPKTKITNVSTFVEQYVQGLLPLQPLSAVRTVVVQ